MAKFDADEQAAMIWPFIRGTKVKARFELNAAGRPIRPQFSPFHHLEDAPPNDRALALEWASLWLGRPEIEVREAADILDSLLMWQVNAKDGSHEARVAEVAWRALFNAKEEYATERTARAIPYIHFEQACCDASAPMQGKFLLATKRPRLPLTDCTDDMCRCRIRHITRAEYKRLTEGDE